MKQQTTLPPTLPHGRYADQPIEVVPKAQLQWMQAMGISVADKIAALLERCDKLKRGSTLDRPVVFNDAGQRHAASVAARDRGVGQFQKLRL